MELKDFNENKKALLKVINDLKLQYVYSKTKLRIGDTVKFTKKGDSYLGEKDIKYAEKIHDFDVSFTGEIYAKCNNHKTPNINDCRKTRINN